MRRQETISFDKTCQPWSRLAAASHMLADAGGVHDAGPMVDCQLNWTTNALLAIDAGGNRPNRNHCRTSLLFNIVGRAQHG